MNRKLVASFVIFATIATLIVSLFIPKEYTSSATVFATETNSLDDAIRNPQFGYDVEADRLIQMLNSRGIRDSIIQKFALIEYYKADTTVPDWYYRLCRKYSKDITCAKTVYMSVVISARTKNPRMSAEIVNTIIGEVNRSRERLLKQNVYQAIASLEQEYLVLKRDLDSLNRMITGVARDQNEVTQFMHSEKYLSLIMDKSKLEHYETSRAMQLLVNHYNMRLSLFYDTEVKLKYARLAVLRPLPSVYVVEKAYPSYRKTYPTLSINVLIAFGGSLFFIIILLYLADRVRMIRNRLRE
jgi:uncharacterized protein involved in exopolysaccharide biosynthesis